MQMHNKLIARLLDKRIIAEKKKQDLHRDTNVFILLYDLQRTKFHFVL